MVPIFKGENAQYLSLKRTISVIFISGPYVGFFCWRGRGQPRAGDLEGLPSGKF
jgi:hypothetical protein